MKRFVRKVAKLILITFCFFAGLRMRHYLIAHPEYGDMVSNVYNESIKNLHELYEDAKNNFEELVSDESVNDLLQKDTDEKRKEGDA